MRGQWDRPPTSGGQQPGYSPDIKDRSPASYQPINRDDMIIGGGNMGKVKRSPPRQQQQQNYEVEA